MFRLRKCGFPEGSHRPAFLQQCLGGSCCCGQGHGSAGTGVWAVLGEGRGGTAPAERFLIHPQGIPDS